MINQGKADPLSLQIIYNTTAGCQMIFGLELRPGAAVSTGSCLFHSDHHGGQNV